MRVTQVSIQPTESARVSGSPALTPELLAASAARYSRNNEGLDAILAKIDPENLDRSVDSIFKMIDYGHQSIADMVPVAMFMDGISIWLAYYVWTLCPTAGGQESSTRYIEISPDSLVDPELLGIADELRADWHRAMDNSFSAYGEALKLWGELGEAQPELTSIPKEVLADDSPKGRRKLERMIRNYRFDRARCYLPVSAATNMMLVMSARGWAQLCRNLSSHPLPEPRRLADEIRSQLELVSPRLMKHSVRTDSEELGIAAEFEALKKSAGAARPMALADDAVSSEAAPDVSLDVMLPSGVDGSALAESMRYHDNRYAWMGSAVCRTAVRFRCEAISMAEIRDLNRHRTGTKYCPLQPLGFYSARDQLPANAGESGAVVDRLRLLADTGRSQSAKAHDLLANGDASYIYWTLLGTQYLFEHVTTADKFIYEAELRTGVGSHYRYAQHLRDALAEWYRLFPETRGLINEGNAEPE